MPETLDLVKLVSKAFHDEIPDFRLTAFYPSSASVKLKDGTVIGGPSSCLRSQYWSYHGVKASNGPTDNEFVKMEMGTAAGEWVAEAVKRLGLYAGAEKRIWMPELNVSGRADVLVYDLDSSGIIPVEVKSVWGHGRMNVIETNRNNPDFAPKTEHVLQLFVYLDFYSRLVKSGKWTGPGFPYGLLFYIARDNGFRAQHRIDLQATRDEWLVPESHLVPGCPNGIKYPVTRPVINGAVQDFTNVDVYSRWVSLKRFIDRKELPPRDFCWQYSKDEISSMAAKGEISKTDTKILQKGRFVKKGSWQCNYCDHRDLCWKGITQDDLWEGVADINTEATA